VDPAAEALPDEQISTSDGVRLSARHDAPQAFAGPGSAHVTAPAASSSASSSASSETAIVVVHGFTGSWRRREVRRVVARFTRFAGVVSFDLRGHGTSGGSSSVGDREVRDLDAAVDWARSLGYRRVVTVGWSLGAAVALRQAATSPLAPAAVAAVSGPSRWNYRGTPSMRLLQVGIGTRIGRFVLANVYGTRISEMEWDPWPIPPDLAAAGLRGRRVLVVHGDADHYFPLEHARWLAAAARAELWVIPGMRHAEGAASTDLLDRLGAWAVQVAEG
jgi:pimeloyl-ACP methyl ester carboxylesterase